MSTEACNGMPRAPIDEAFPGFLTSQNKKVTDKARWVIIMGKNSVQRNQGDMAE